MTWRSVPAIDPAGVAARLGADGYGIVCAVLAGGIEAGHAHFERHTNFDLPPPLRHRDFTLGQGEDGAVAEVDEDLLAEEALIDIQGHGTHVAGIVAGHSDPRVAGVEWSVDQPTSGVAPRCKLMSLKVVDDDGHGNEKTLLAALEHVKAVNAGAGNLLVQVVLVPLGFEWVERAAPLAVPVAPQVCGAPEEEVLSRALDWRAGQEHSAPAAPPPEPVAPHAPAASLPLAVGPAPAPAPAAAPGRRFAVAFSFAGEHDDYVRHVVKALREIGRLPRSRIFYHKHFEAELSRPDLDLYLQDIYANQSELLVVMLSRDYERKEWTGLEWRLMRELIKKRAGYAVMPFRFDDTHVPGLFSIDGYSSAADRTPEEAADLILDRLELNRAQRRD